MQNEKHKIAPSIDTIKLDNADGIDLKPVDNVQPAEVIIEMDGQKIKQDIVLQNAQKFVDKIVSGESPSAAARSIGTTVGKITNSVDMKAAVQALIDKGSLDKVVRNKMVEAGLNALFMRNVDSYDVKAQKIALEAAKLIGQQEGSVPGDVGVTIDLGDLGVVLRKGIDLPGLEDNPNG